MRIGTSIALSVVAATLLGIAPSQNGKNAPATRQSAADPSARAKTRRADELFAAFQVAESSIDPEKPATLEAFHKAREAQAELEDLLATEPAVRDHLREPLWRVVDRHVAEDIRHAAFELLTHDADARTTTRLGRRLAEDAAILDAEHVIALAERGVAAAEKRLAAIVAAGGEHGFDQVWPAVWFGLRGDARGVAILEEFTAAEGFFENSPDAAVACAAALLCLGKKAAWAQACRSVRATIAACEAKDRLRNGAWGVLRLEYFGRNIGGQTPASVARMSRPLLAFIQEEIGKVGDLAEVERRLEREMARAR